jgi:hypothetical protein
MIHQSYVTRGSAINGQGEAMSRIYNMDSGLSRVKASCLETSDHEVLRRTPGR